MNKNLRRYSDLEIYHLRDYLLKIGVAEKAVFSFFVDPSWRMVNQARTWSESELNKR